MQGLRIVFTILKDTQYYLSVYVCLLQMYTGAFTLPFVEARGQSQTWFLTEPRAPQLS